MTYSTTFADTMHASGLDPARMFQMPVFKPGVKVMHGGQEETVSHVVLRRREMVVYLVGHEEPIRPHRLALQPLWFTTERQPQALNWYL